MSIAELLPPPLSRPNRQRSCSKGAETLAEEVRDAFGLE
jgi:hypothetical protein